MDRQTDTLSTLYIRVMHVIQGAAVEFDDIRISVLVNRVEYKKHNCGVSVVKCHFIYALYFKKTTHWHAVRSYNCDRK
jgi:hypothetical protein